MVMQLCVLEPTSPTRAFLPVSSGCKGQFSFPRLHRTKILGLRNEYDVINSLAFQNITPAEDSLMLVTCKNHYMTMSHSEGWVCHQLFWEVCIFHKIKQNFETICQLMMLLAFSLLYLSNNAEPSRTLCDSHETPLI